MTNTADWVHNLAASLRADVVETHISWLLLAADVVYKLKKAVRLPFVNYSTLERRRHFCEEEVRLNRRLAPTLYLGVSRVTGTADTPQIDGGGATLDYAVRMRRFPAGALFSEQLAAGTLSEDSVDRFALRLAQFHESSPQARNSPCPRAGRRERVLLAALEGAAPVLGAEAVTRQRAWIVKECTLLEPLWLERRAKGRVHECHGDLHLANVAGLVDEIVAFDCIEFDPALRWIDVLEDAAFPLMDFVARGRADLGWRFFNAWLEITGDYVALPALRLSVVGRALVRSQVEHLRASGSAEAYAYARTALAWSRSGQPRLSITHGLPGSGKSYVAQRLLQQQGAIRLRSDVERKRLFGLQPLDDSRAKDLDLYAPEATRQTYARLFALARTALEAGFPAVLDAAFLRYEERQQALALARELNVPFSIVVCEAPLPVLRQRIQARRNDPSEANLVVLDKLRMKAEPLRSDEFPFSMADRQAIRRALRQPHGR